MEQSCFVITLVEAPGCSIFQSQPVVKTGTEEPLITEVPGTSTQENMLMTKGWAYQPF